MASAGNPFSAADSALGYLFQCRYALLDSLRRVRQGEDFLVSVETLEDVSFEAEGQPAELLQTKHHRDRDASITDASVDLWGTLHNWGVGTLAGRIEDDSIFYLLTTSTASDNSVASLLRRNEFRDVDSAFEKLVVVARKSKNRDNLNAYRLFLSNEMMFKSILERVFILDASIPITEIPKAIRNEVRLAVNKKFLESFVERLEGWWFGRVIRQMSAPPDSMERILCEELEAQTSELRGQFQDDSLPIDDSVKDVEIDATSHMDRRFVRQLRLINLKHPRILIAIREYFRAFEQRSRWIREDLLLVGELDRYENRLSEEWQIYFERMREELGDEAAEEQKVKSARALYDWVESKADFPIRPRCNEPFVTRGSFHILADDLKVGWHPDFANRVKELLNVEDVDE